VKGLYVVTPDWEDTDRLVEVTRLALQGGAAVVQYRNKTASDELRREQAARLVRLCEEFGRPLIVNDHVQLCIDVAADGVHVGELDDSVARAREAVGPGKIVGGSCYGHLDLARAASESGATYIAFGGFYPSRVKKYPVTTPARIIRDAKAAFGKPVCVIGGMTAQNAAPLIAEGADMVAAISTIYMAEDPERAAREIATLFDAYSSTSS
jgi:thiamine-phosphate pyrophosphorylase